MNRPTRKDIESYSKKELVEFTDHLLNEVDYSVFLIKKLEDQLAVALEELGSKNQRVLEIIEQIDALKNKQFGRSSEKSSTANDIFSAIAPEKKPENPSDKGSSKPKRKKAEDKVASDTPINEIFHYANAEVISNLGLEIWEGYYETSDLITVIPTQVRIDRHHRQKYFYIDQETGERRFYTASGPIKLRDGSQYSIEFISQVVTDKYCYHLPFDRQATMFATKGLTIGTSSLLNQSDYAAFTLKNSVFMPIVEFLEKSKIVQADDTTWPNLEDLKTRTQDKYYLWGMMNEKAVAFNIFNARSQKVAKDFLGKQEGILLTDGHNSFEGLVSSSLILASDWCHTRRYFVKAEKFFPEEAKLFIDQINTLFALEKSYQGKPPDEIVKERHLHSRPILDTISNLLDDTPHLKTTSLGKAIGYTKRLWDRLIVFLNHGDLPLSSNGIERSMRTPALGRKNHLGSKNMETAKIAAIWYTIVETCKLNKVNVEDYIAYALTATLQGLKPLLPWEYSTNNGTR